jgi:hypothetical protein
VRRANIDPSEVKSADQTTVVVLMNDPGEQVVDLVGGYYFLNVAIAVPKGTRTATVTPVI